MITDAELDYLEKLFGDAYRKEIDQEENVWRTLPFFAATLALQLAGLAQVRDWVGGVQGWLYWLSLTLLGAAVGQQWVSALISATLRCKVGLPLGPTPALVYTRQDGEGR